MKIAVARKTLVIALLHLYELANGGPIEEDELADVILRLEVILEVPSSERWGAADGPPLVAFSPSLYR